VPTELQSRDIGGITVAAIFVLIGVLALWDTFDYTDADSFVFPRTVAGSMIVFCIALIAWSLVRPIDVGSRGAESTPRRVGLVTAMLIAALLMPYTGFLLSGLLAFAAIVSLAMYDPWTRGRLIVYPLVGSAIVLGFYFLFTKVLLVPLPTGRLFMG
jgi:hypothetical protein